MAAGIVEAALPGSAGASLTELVALSRSCFRLARPSRISCHSLGVALLTCDIFLYKD